MRLLNRKRIPLWQIVAGIWVGLIFCESSYAATRDLPGGYTSDTSLSVTIFLESPIGTTAVGLEDLPPVGWTVSNISIGGSFDGLTGKVKWGPFLESLIPDWVSYDVKPPVGESGIRCFFGEISFDGFNENISGDECISDECIPDCANRECGDDGCGGICGLCESPSVCNSVIGLCECIPDCAGRACGPDGCGLLCGVCPKPEICDETTGLCGCIPDCANLECGLDPICDISCGECSLPFECMTGRCECIPTCSGRECGDDGCGGSCGSCNAPDVCNDFSGLCECAPDCTNRECSPDGCGALCGICVEPSLCNELSGHCELPGCAASRDLSDPLNAYIPSEAKTIHIELSVPQGTIAIGLEDAPPSGWFITNISDGGIYDMINDKLKWGPFFVPFPLEVAYDVTPASNVTGILCFTGTISVDGLNQDICGNQCIDLAQPGDLDGNGSIDLNDWKLFYLCIGGPNVLADPECPSIADMNDDGVIDLRDVSLFMILFDG